MRQQNVAQVSDRKVSAPVVLKFAGTEAASVLRHLKDGTNLTVQFHEESNSNDIHLLLDLHGRNYIRLDELSCQRVTAILGSAEGGFQRHHNRQFTFTMRPNFFGFEGVRNSFVQRLGPRLREIHVHA